MKVVQIGVGGWGKNHSRVLSEIGVLSAICDTNSQLAEEFGKKYGSSKAISIRINPHIAAGGNKKIQTGHVGSKFGISVLQMS